MQPGNGMLTQRGLVYAALLALPLCACTSGSGLYTKHQRPIIGKFDRALKPLAPEIWVKLNASGENGALFIFSDVDAQTPSVNYVFAASPEQGIRTFAGTLPEGAVCVFRYKDALPLAPTASLCSDHRRLADLYSAVEQNRADTATIRADLATLLGRVTAQEEATKNRLESLADAVKAVRRSADDTLQTIKSDVARYSTR